MSTFRGEHLVDCVFDGTPIFTGTLAVSGATTLASTSQSGAATFATGTGAVSLNGATTVASGKTLAVTSNATVGGTLVVTGVATSTGVVDASNATVGTLGEVISSLVAVGSPVSLATGTAKTITSISLTAGDWDVEGNVNFTAGSATVVAGAYFGGGISLTNNTLPTDGSEVPVGIPAIVTTSFLAGEGLPCKRVNVSTATTVYLVGEATFSAGTVGGYGSITARRKR